MRTALAFAFSLLSGAAFAHPSVVTHQHPHDWSLLPDANLIVLAAVALGISAIVLAYRAR